MKKEIIGMSIEQEYQSLRNELIQNKRHVFERPMLTVVALFAATRFIAEKYLPFLPLVAIILLIFNLWFTATIIRSLARIAAYIQVFLEPGKEHNWIGWETYLRLQRKWINKNSKEKRDKILKKQMDEYAIPETLLYYQPLYYFHIVFILISMGFSFALAFKNLDTTSIISLIITGVVIIYFFIQNSKFKPFNIISLIEEYKVICEEVLKDNNIHCHY